MNSEDHPQTPPSRSFLQEGYRDALRKDPSYFFAYAQLHADIENDAGELKEAQIKVGFAAGASVIGLLGDLALFMENFISSQQNLTSLFLWSVGTAGAAAFLFVEGNRAKTIEKRKSRREVALRELELYILSDFPGQKS